MDVKELSVTSLSSWLEEKGVQYSFCEVFEDNEIDGEAFLELTEKDIKDLVKPLGVVKKLMRLQTSVKLPVSNDSIASHSPCESSCEVNDFGQIPQSSSSMPVPSSRCSQYSNDASRNEFVIPLRWKPTIMNAIEKQQLNPEVRNEIVRDLVTHVYAHVEKPTMMCIGDVARKLVDKYPFMSDTGAAHFGSWQKKMMDRVYNVEKGRKRNASQSEATPPAKRGRSKKIDSILGSRYPAVQHTDDANADENQKALEREMEHNKPRKDIVLPLMNKLFYNRRQYLLKSTESVVEKATKFPALKMTSVIEQELELILSKQNIYRAFVSEWTQKWVPAIIKYCKTLKRNDIKALLLKDDDEEKSAVKLLFQLLCVQRKKKEGNLGDFFNEYEMSENPEIVASSEGKNTPWIGEFSAEDGDITFFVFVEQSVFCTVTSFSKEFVFGLPDNVSIKNGTYLSVTTDIQSLA